MTSLPDPGPAVPWEELVALVRERVRSQIRDPDDCEDLVQEALLQVLAYAADHGVQSWHGLARRVADKVVAYFLRQKKRKGAEPLLHPELVEDPAASVTPEGPPWLPAWVLRLVRGMRLGPADQRVWEAFVAGHRGAALTTAAATSRRQVRRTLRKIFRAIREKLR